MRWCNARRPESLYIPLCSYYYIPCPVLRLTTRDEGRVNYRFRETTTTTERSVVMEWWTLLLVASLCVTPSLSRTPRLWGAGTGRVSYVPSPAGMSQHVKTSVGGETIPYDDLGKILTVSSESFVRFLSQDLSQLLSIQAAAGRRAPQGGLQCVLDFVQLFQMYTSTGPYNHSLGAQAIDAFGKPGSGVLQGNMYAYGSFDECFAIGEDKVQYLIAPVTVVKVIGNFTKFIPLFTFDMGMCIPQSCDGSDVENFINEANTKYILPHTNNTYALSVNGTLIDFTKSKRLPYSTGAIVMITVCALLAALVVAATFIDILLKLVSYILKMTSTANVLVNEDPVTPTEQSPLLGRIQNKKNSQQWKVLDFIIAFSLFKNVPMILATKQPPNAITSLNGIRVLSMFWVILCHTYVWAAMSGIVNNGTVFLTNVVPRFSFQVILNGYFAVDSFFFLSGALVAYLTLREMERRKGWFPFITYYLHRYLRLTMVYAFVLFFYWTLTVYLGDGNRWIAATGPDSDVQKNCERYWWTNLLYINNLYPWKLQDECIGWAWYLANDMQFYVIAPLIIIPLFFFFPIGLTVSGVLLTASFAATGAIAGVNDYSANTFQQTPNATAESHQSDDIYVKPYCRIAPYIVGLVLGYLLHKKVRFPFHFLVNWIMYGCLWLIAAGCCHSTVYGLYDTWHGHELSLAENVSYFMFSRFTWAVGLALMVFACHNGYGWVINDFLSMKFWIPLSRLTYTAYLVHPIVLTVIFTSMRDTITYTDNTLVVHAVAMVVLSYGTAGVVATFVEFPLSNLEMTLFKVVGLRLRESTRRVEVQVERNVEEHGSRLPSSPPPSVYEREKPEKIDPN